MRPSPIPAAEVWEGGRRQVIAGPDGDLTNDTIRPVEAVVDVALGVPSFCVRMVLEGDDLEQLQAGGVVWIRFLGHVVPFVAEVRGPLA